MAEGGFHYTESETGYNSMYSRHSRNHVESVSVEICTIMTRLGYGEEMRRWRVKKYREWDRLKNLLARHENIQIDLTKITAGSKAEGLTCYCESDYDILYVLNRVLCVEGGINLHTIPNDIHVFKMDTRAYPGHCRLLHERPGSKRFRIIYNALCDNGYGSVLLSSSLLLDAFSKDEITQESSMVNHERAGPSIPGSVEGVFLIDRVFALRCHCPSILQRWAGRPRHWPSSDIVQKVVSLGAFLTPTGFKGSEYKHMEWRICFNTGEAELVNNLNDTYVKAYVILKMILKDVIKPNNKEITSYVLKNIILWQAENTPQTKFHSQRLLDWLHDGLRELRTAIEKKQLRYYMIPERNLMAACGMDDALQSKWIADITDMLGEGPRVILRLEKVRKAIIASPEPMLWFSQKRMELEMLYLEWLERLNRNLAMHLIDENRKIDEFVSMQDAICMRFLDILKEMTQRMPQEGSFGDDSAIRYIFRRVFS